jgi:hypothetical protein
MEEEIYVKDWWEEMGGGQTEPMRSQVKEFSGRERYRLWWGGWLSLARRI